MSNQSATRQRTEVPFRRAEWDLLVKLPGRVVVAATSAQADPARRTVAEGLAGIAEVLDGCRTAGQLLAERVGRMDADAYRFWLVAIATRVCHAARTGSTLGFGGEPISPAERRFLTDLEAALSG